MPQRILSESEFTAIRDSVLKALPAGLKEDEFNRLAPSMLAQAIGEAESSPEPVTGSAVGRFVSNAAEMLNPITMATGAYQAVRHPLETVANVAGQMGQQWQQAGTAAREGRPTEAVARAVAGSVPLVGPMVAQIGEQAGEGDIAGAAGKLTGLAVPFAAERALSARAASRAASKAPILEQQAIDQVAQKVLAPGAPAWRGRAQAIAPEILKRGYKGGRDELRQIAEEVMDDAANRIDARIQATGGVTAQVPIAEYESGINARITGLKDSAGHPLSDQAAKRIQALEKRKYQIRALGGKRGTVQFEDFRKLRDEDYRIANEARAYERAGNPALADEGWAARENGGIIRELFARRDPETAAANADYTFGKTLHDILDPAIGRPKSMKPTEGVTGGARTTGAVVGHLAGSKAVTFVSSVVIPWVRERMADSSWQLADAHAKMKLADAMKRGDIGGMQSWMVRIGKAGQATRPNAPQTEPVVTR